MLEFLAIAWAMALAVTASLYLVVLFVQGVARMVARLARGLRPGAAVQVADESAYEASA